MYCDPDHSSTYLAGPGAATEQSLSNDVSQSRERVSLGNRLGVTDRRSIRWDGEFLGVPEMANHLCPSTPWRVLTTVWIFSSSKAVPAAIIFPAAAIRKKSRTLQMLWPLWYSTKNANKTCCECCRLSNVYLTQIRLDILFSIYGKTEQFTRPERIDSLDPQIVVI